MPGSVIILGCVAALVVAAALGWLLWQRRRKSLTVTFDKATGEIVPVTSHPSGQRELISSVGSGDEAVTKAGEPGSPGPHVQMAPMLSALDCTPQIKSNQIKLGFDLIWAHYRLVIQSMFWAQELRRRRPASSSGHRRRPAVHRRKRHRRRGPTRGVQGRGG